MPIRSAEHIAQHIRDTWADAVVAEWVLENLELLWIHNTKDQAPIYHISRDNNSYIFADQPPPPHKKLVLSGGLEGTRGHVDAVSYLSEAAALMNGTFMTTLLLEPDSYARNQKNREPLVYQYERAELWSKTGLVDVVICLPDKPEDESWKARCELISILLGPETEWYTTSEHPQLLEVLTRSMKNFINLLQLIPETPSVHASFLAATKNMSEEEFNPALLEYEHRLFKRFTG